MSSDVKTRSILESEKQKNNPCAEEYAMSMKCLDDNNYDHSQCKVHFQNYKYCLKFWSWIKSRRRREGIEPAMPPPEEREQVKQKYLSQLRGS